MYHALFNYKPQSLHCGHGLALELHPRSDGWLPKGSPQPALQQELHPHVLLQGFHAAAAAYLEAQPPSRCPTGCAGRHRQPAAGRQSALQRLAVAPMIEARDQRRWRPASVAPSGARDHLAISRAAARESPRPLATAAERPSAAGQKILQAQVAAEAAAREIRWRGPGGSARARRGGDRWQKGFGA